jgi:hypothetical protein
MGLSNLRQARSITALMLADGSLDSEGNCIHSFSVGLLAGLQTGFDDSVVLMGVVEVDSHAIQLQFF